MRTNLLVMLLAFASACTALAAQDRPTPVPPANVASGQIYITHVTVIDMETGKELQDRTVVISGGRISEVKDSKNPKPPAGVRVVEGTGQFLIPGLWDMHVHMRGSLKGSTPNFAGENEAMLPLYLANGVTGVREMGGDLVDLVLQWRSEVERGKRLSPRIATSGPKLDGAKPMWPGSIAITTDEEARAAVQQVKAMGVDFVKVYSASPNIPHDAYLALLDEAKRQQMPVTGHVPFTVTVAEVSDAGQNIEHATQYLPGCVRNEKELKADRLAKRITFSNYQMAFLDGYSVDVAKALFARFAANHTWVTPTLAGWSPAANASQDALDKDPRRKYIMPRMLASWGDRPENSATLTPQEVAVLSSVRKKMFQRGLESVRLMHKAEVSILAGTDTGASNANHFPGFSLHDELAVLVEAGLTPLEALQCATLNAAKWLKRLDTLGTVETGKFADLVLLEADPLRDIHNTTKISEVFLAGKEFDRAALDQMLKAAETAAERPAANQSSNLPATSGRAGRGATLP